MEVALWPEKKFRERGLSASRRHGDVDVGLSAHAARAPNVGPGNRDAVLAAEKALKASGVDYDKLRLQRGASDHRFLASKGRERTARAMVIVTFDETLVFTESNKPPHKYGWGTSLFEAARPRPRE